MMEEITGIKVPPNRAIIGDRIFHVEAGIVASWFKNCTDHKPLELFPIKWDLVGQQDAQVVLGKGSGADSVRLWLDKIGWADALSEEQILVAVNRVKEQSMEKAGLMSTHNRHLQESIKKLRKAF